MAVSQFLIWMSFYIQKTIEREINELSKSYSPLPNNAIFIEVATSSLEKFPKEHVDLIHKKCDNKISRNF